MKSLQIVLIAASFLLSNLTFADALDDMIEKAEATRLQAAEAGFEWTTTAELINSARISAKAGDAKLAMALAEKALRQGENSLRQAKYAEEHWQEYEPG